jgi:hypothetical protein
MGHNLTAERHDGRPASKSSRIQACRGSLSRATKKGAYSRIDVVRVGMRKLKRDTRVSHHTFENILRNKFVGHWAPRGTYVDSGTQSLISCPAAYLSHW